MAKFGFGQDQAPALPGFEEEVENAVGQASVPVGNSSVSASPLADLAWQVRAWGRWILDRARRDLAPYYPTYADFEPLVQTNSYEHRAMQLFPLNEDGTPNIDELNKEFDEKWLKDPTKPRWVAKPTVAYLWARNVKCKNCRSIVPLLKTRWLCKKETKRVALEIQ